MKRQMAIAFALFALSAFAERPAHFWNFDSGVDGSRVADAGSSAKKNVFYADALRLAQGVGGSTACWVGKGKPTQVPYCRIDSDAWTIDLRFRLDGAFDDRRGHALWSYAWNSWRRGRALARLTKDRRLEIAFHRPAQKDGSQPVVDFKAASEPLDVAPGRYHSVRVALTAEGELTAYFDGVLAVRKGGCPGLRGIYWKTDAQGYPLFRVGLCDDDPQNPRDFLGLVDDVAIYETALGAPELSFGGSGARGASARPAEEESADSVLVLAGGRGRTAPFAIKDKVGDGVSNGILLGAVVRSDEKFQRCRASATVSVDEKLVTVEVACPVPDGVEVKRNQRSPWSGDAVEVFIRPEVGKALDFHYAVNAAGLTGCEKIVGGAPTRGWKSAFRGECRNGAKGFTLVFRIPREEIFETMPKEGDVFAAQFIRVGPTTDGVASWKPTATSFYDPSTFGRVVYGSCGAYFERQVAAARRTAAEKFGDAGSRAEAEKAIGEFAAAVGKHGGDAGAFGALEAMQANLSQTFLQISLKGKKLLAYSPADAWGNDLEPNALTRPVEKIAMRVARNGKAFASFALANLSDRPYVGQVKLIERQDDLARFSKFEASGLARRLTVREGFSIKTGAGTALWDPLAPLPLGTVLRVAPRATSTVWLEFDAKGLDAGLYAGALCLKRGVPGFETEMLPVEIEVVDVDLGEVEADRACYTYLVNSKMGPRFAEFLVSRDFNVIYAGVPGQSSLPIYPRYARNGKLLPSDFCTLDRVIDRHLAAGMEKRRVKLWFYMALDTGWWIPEGSGPVLGDKWCVAMKAFLEQLYAHVGEKYGITADRIVLYPVDEPSGDPDDPKSKMGRTCLVGEKIRSFGARYHLLVNPLPGIPMPVWRRSLERLSKSYDIVEFYRPGLTPEMIAFAKALPFREIWTYSILGKEVNPSPFRRDYWTNMRDGFREIATYWHLDSMQGGDGLDSTDMNKGGKSACDYGTVYADWNLDQVMTSRRQVASDMGFEDARLILWLRAKAKAKGDAALSAKIDAVVKKAADAGSMAAMDAARDELLAIAAELR